MAAVTNKGDNCKVPALRSRDPENQDPWGNFFCLELGVAGSSQVHPSRLPCQCLPGPSCRAVYLYTVRPCRGEGTFLYERNAFLN